MMCFSNVAHLCVLLTHISYMYGRNDAQRPTTHNKNMMTSSNGNISRVTGHLCDEFTSQRPVTRSFAVFFDLRLNKRLSKQSRRRWFQMPSLSLWRHCNVIERLIDSPHRGPLKPLWLLWDFIRLINCGISTGLPSFAADANNLCYKINFIGILVYWNNIPFCQGLDELNHWW